MLQKLQRKLQNNLAYMPNLFRVKPQPYVTLQKLKIGMKYQGPSKYLRLIYGKSSVHKGISVFMPPTSKKLRGHIGLGLSVQSVSLSVSQSVSQSVCLSVMREHSVRNR